MSLEEKFRRAAEDVKNLKKKPTESELLCIYSLYKQAEIGDCNILLTSTESVRAFSYLLAKPGFFDFLGKAKWEAWNERKGVPQESAKEEYVLKAEELIKKYGVN